MRDRRELRRRASAAEIGAVGHRVVHGGPDFHNPIRTSNGLFSFSFLAISIEFLTVIAAELPFHSMRPSHTGTGGFSGRPSPISYRDTFWLLEPELRTRFFICR